MKIKKGLNIGAGNIPLEGFLNIDKYYYPGCGSPNLNEKLAKEWEEGKHKGMWAYGDAVELKGIKNDYFDVVLMVHVVEHMSMEKGNDAIKKAINALKPGGFIEIEVPDLFKACHLMQTVKFKADGPNHHWFKIMGLLHGTTGKDGEGQFHLCGYTKNYLKCRMREHGIKNIEEIKVGFGHGRPEPEYNFRLRGWK